MKSLMVVTLLIGSTAANSQDSQYLEKSQPAPYTGILFTESKAQSIRNELLEGDKNKLLLETEKHRTARLGEIVKLKDEEIELYNKQNQRLLKVNDRSDTMQYIWFGLGVIVTGAAVYGAGALSR